MQYWSLFVNWRPDQKGFVYTERTELGPDDQLASQRNTVSISIDYQSWTWKTMRGRSTIKFESANAIMSRPEILDFTKDIVELYFYYRQSRSCSIVVIVIFLGRPIFEQEDTRFPNKMFLKF